MGTQQDFSAGICLGHSCISWCYVVQRAFLRWHQQHLQNSSFYTDHIGFLALMAAKKPLPRHK